MKKLTLRDLEKYNYGIFTVTSDVTVIAKLDGYDETIASLSDLCYSYDEYDSNYDNSETTYQLRYNDYITVYETDNMEDLIDYINKHYTEIQNQTLNK